uniref:Uncharacterized protein n=1 Tax=Paramoeba aestuarina TaxID=180227 RepID=A0A7S4KUB7_9EUKA|mmetsp:Transcript_25258/g.39425  ORF Transcript_25258/g.39425 Transcript_25258/m.39425 type:complete len:244 (+) Transcript_25258:41-772(+)
MNDTLKYQSNYPWTSYLSKITNSSGLESQKPLNARKRIVLKTSLTRPRIAMKLEKQNRLSWSSKRFLVHRLLLITSTSHHLVEHISNFDDTKSIQATTRRCSSCADPINAFLYVILDSFHGNSCDKKSLQHSVEHLIRECDNYKTTQQLTAKYTQPKTSENFNGKKGTVFPLTKLRDLVTRNLSSLFQQRLVSNLTIMKYSRHEELRKRLIHVGRATRKMPYGVHVHVQPPEVNLLDDAEWAG